MSDYKKDENERGALWEKTSAKGTYFTGTIDGEPCVIFKNTNKKEGSNAPDWRVLKPTPKADAPAVSQSAPITDDSIPF